MSINQSDLNNSPSSASGIDAQILGVENDIKTVDAQLTAANTKIKEFTENIEMVETCLDKTYSDWSEAAKTKYGVGKKKYAASLKRKLTYLLNGNSNLNVEKTSLLRQKESLLLQKEGLIQLLLQQQGTKRAKITSDTRQEEAKQRGKDFVNSILTLQLEVIVEGQLYYMKEVSTLLGEKSNIILSQTICDFWLACIKHVDQGTRVCASGSPGVGKSTTMLYLIWVLLNLEKRVVYILRTPENIGFYYEFIKHEEGVISTNVYPESTDIEVIIDKSAEAFKNTYLLCDPGKTKTDMMPPMDFLVKVIGNASADDRHWGGSDFTKRRGSTVAIGVVLTFPMLTKKQIFRARTSFINFPDAQILEERHRDFGSIPRYLFETVASILEQRIFCQDSFLNSLELGMARNIMNGIEEMNNNNEQSPKSIIMCVTSKPPNFMKSIASFVSDRVVEETSKRHIVLLWNEISSEDSSQNRGYMFEAFVRTLFCSTTKEFRSRTCCGKTVPKDEYKNIRSLRLGGCSRIQRTADIIGACRNSADLTIFYSYKEREPLVDFIYKLEKDFYAIQVTIQTCHDCADNKLTDFLAKLGLQEDEKLTLVYAVPNNKFSEFTTNPVQPKVPYDVAHQVSIWHAEINPPDQKV